MTNDNAEQRTDILLIGAGIAGLTALLELRERGYRGVVTVLDAAPAGRIGGQARDAFGGMLFACTDEQRRQRIPDSIEQFREDWLHAAGFSERDTLARDWAEYYVAHSGDEVYRWLKQHGVAFVPSVQWVERFSGEYGNRLPRYHVAWGCGRGLVRTLIASLSRYQDSCTTCWLFEHRVTGLLSEHGRVVGGIAQRRPAGDTDPSAVRVFARHVLVCSGGIGGNPELVKHHWDRTAFGEPPENMLYGAIAEDDGELHKQINALGGQVANLHWMWNYAAGIAHPEPAFPDHGLSLIAPRSALWLDCYGQRIGPDPLVSGFDTRALCQRVAALPGGYSWQLMNWRIAAREMAISGTDTNPVFRDHQWGGLLWQLLRGNQSQLHWMTRHCRDVLVADTLPALAAKMNALTGKSDIEVASLEATVAAYDAEVRRGPALATDLQLLRIHQVRRYFSDRLRTCTPRPMLDRHGGPLIAIRQRLIMRKSMGGVCTDLDSCVINHQGKRVPGLYAAGEAAGFGGGGIAGPRSLEGTFLSACILTARHAAAAIVRSEHQAKSTL